MTFKIKKITEEVAEVVDQFLPGLEGACLGTCAMLAVTLKRYGVITDAVHGTYGGEAHWWLETHDLRIDPTRRQFGDGTMVEPLLAGADSPYVEELRMLARWTEEQAVLEFARMFVYRDIGMKHGREVLRRLLGSEEA